MKKFDLLMTSTQCMLGYSAAGSEWRRAVREKGMSECNLSRCPVCRDFGSNYPPLTLVSERKWFMSASVFCHIQHGDTANPFGRSTIYGQVMARWWGLRGHSDIRRLESTAQLLSVFEVEAELMKKSSYLQLCWQRPGAQMTQLN